MFGDPTLLKEYLSYYLLTEIGVDTEEFAYTNLYINNKYKGVYFMLEPIDNSLEQRTLNDDSDFFIKPGVFGGNLVYDKKLDKYISNLDKKSLDEIETIISEVRDIVFESGELPKQKDFRSQFKDSLKDKNYREFFKCQ